MVYLSCLILSCRKLFLIVIKFGASAKSRATLKLPAKRRIKRKRTTMPTWLSKSAKMLKLSIVLAPLHLHLLHIYDYQHQPAIIKWVLCLTQELLKHSLMKPSHKNADCSYHLLPQLCFVKLADQHYLCPFILLSLQLSTTSPPQFEPLLSKICSKTYWFPSKSY